MQAYHFVKRKDGSFDTDGMREAIRAFASRDR